MRSREYLLSIPSWEFHISWWYQMEAQTQTQTNFLLPHGSFLCRSSWGLSNRELSLPFYSLMGVSPFNHSCAVKHNQHAFYSLMGVSGSPTTTLRQDLVRSLFLLPHGSFRASGSMCCMVQWEVEYLSTPSWEFPGKGTGYVRRWVNFLLPHGSFRWQHSCHV